MPSTPEAPDPAEHTRITDTDRNTAVSQLTGAVGAGRLTLEEFQQRSVHAYATTTREDLDRLTSDLPTTPGQTVATGETAPRVKRRWRIAVMSGLDLRGRWRVPRRLGLVAVMGGSTIDLREAVLEGGDIDLTLVAVMGGHEVIVPGGVRVEMDEVNVLGGSTIKTDEAATVDHAPVLRLHAISVMGGSTVRHPTRRTRR